MTIKNRRGNDDSAGKAPHIEPYQLPRWDALGKAIETPKDSRPDSGTVEDVADTEHLKSPTADDIRQIHEDAYNEGFESGFEQGMKQGQATGQAEGHKAGLDSGKQEGLKAGHEAGLIAGKEAETERISAELAPLSELLKQLQDLLPEQKSDLESGLVVLATRIARNVIDAEMSLQPDHINQLVHAAVQALPNADERFTLELNPDDVQYVSTIAEPHWNLVPTPAVTRGGCVIRTRFSYIDYSLEHRYRQQVSNLLAHIGLSERLTELEQPWTLPEADSDAGSDAGTDSTLDITEQHQDHDGVSSNKAETDRNDTAGEIDSMADNSAVQTDDDLAQPGFPDEQETADTGGGSDDPDVSSQDQRQSQAESDSPGAAVDSHNSAGGLSSDAGAASDQPESADDVHPNGELTDTDNGVDGKDETQEASDHER